jgi:hypothetical protein
MERVLSGANKIILDGKAGQGVIPFLQVDPNQPQVRPKGIN